MISDEVIEDSVIVTEEEKKIIKEIIYEIPFYFRPSSTSPKFPYFGHRLSARPFDENDFNHLSKIDIESNYFNFFYNLVYRFCRKHNIEYKNVIRSFINSTFYVDGYKHTDPHVDSCVNHIVILIYLNEISTSSKTIVYEKIKNPDETECLVDVDSQECKTLKIKKEISPDFCKIVAFDGKYFHSNKIPLPGENRIVCVFNLLT